MKKDELIKENQRLKTELEKIKAELDEANRIVRRKTVEVNAILAQAEEVSHVDKLTWLPNRRKIMKDLQDEVVRAERYGTTVSVSMIDIDHFKKINDTYGHSVGDQALFELASLLQSEIRDTDRIGRYGGEEFLVVLPNTSLSPACEQAERLLTHVRELVIDTGEKLQLTISIGLAEYRHGKDDWQKFLSRADMALYEAKNDGRDRWVSSE